MARLFPQNEDTLVIVVDGATPELADDAAGRLAKRLAARPDMFISVRRPDASDFFRRNGLLFLPTAEVEQLTDALAKAQPLMAALASDPSVNGLFGAFNLALEGAANGQLDPAELDRSFAAIADSLQAAQAGHGPPLSWQRLLTGREPTPMELQRIILAKPVLDNSQLRPGAAPSALVRSTAAELGLNPANGVRVRLTGVVALNDEEFGSLQTGHRARHDGSFIVVLCWLFLALRSFKPMFAIACTLLVGLISTFAFAFAAVQALNLISVAFAAMFIGIAVDFGIQVCVRYRDERHKHDDLAIALRRTGRSIGGPLFLAAITTAAGFLAFVPTAYRGRLRAGRHRRRGHADRARPQPDPASGAAHDPQAGRRAGARRVRLGGPARPLPAAQPLARAHAGGNSRHRRPRPAAVPAVRFQSAASEGPAGGIGRHPAGADAQRGDHAQHAAGARRRRPTRRRRWRRAWKPCRR